MFKITVPLVILGAVLLFIFGYFVWLAQALYYRIKYGERIVQPSKPTALTATVSLDRIHSEGMSGITAVDSRSSIKSSLKDDEMDDKGPKEVKTIVSHTQRMIEGRDIADMPLSDLSHLTPYRSRGFKKDPANYMTMGLRKLDLDNWLTVDGKYYEFYQARRQLLSEKKQEVLQVKPGGEAACGELLGEVVGFLTKKYPEEYEIFEGEQRRKWVRNRMTKEEFAISMPYNVHPLEVVARLAMEDFNVLIKSQFTGNHHL